MTLDVEEDLEFGGHSVMVAELKISFTSSYHDEINSLWTGSVTHCMYCD